jgi:hypothetical protein
MPRAAAAAMLRPVDRRPHRDLHPGLDREAADEAAAADARRRLRDEGIVAIEPDERIAVMLVPGERVVAVRRAVSVERRTAAHDRDASMRGDLYVTTARLVCLGPGTVDVPLRDISDAVVAAGVLRLAVGDGRGLEIRTEDPCLLRAEVSVVREAARLAAPPPEPSGVAPDPHLSTEHDQDQEARGGRQSSSR